MSSSRPLHLMSVTDGCSDSIFWITIDGDDDSLTPGTITLAFPEFFSSVSIVTQDAFEFDSDERLEVVRNKLRTSSVCLFEDRYETRIYTADAQLHKEILKRLIDCLPE